MDSSFTMVDLGCGRTKLPGFIGVDRFALPGVDIIADIDQKIPFADNSVDLIYAAHSLEHVNDLMNVMKEIYRISKHGTQICITAPYYEQKGNFANPYHKQVFNEHTPRFWTNHPTSIIPKEWWECPHAIMWGLAGSDNSDQNIDFRCLNMEFFYYPEYRSLSEEEKFKARKTLINVCDQIMYHLVVIKEPTTDEDCYNLCKNMVLFEPPAVIERKKIERFSVKINVD